MTRLKTNILLAALLTGVLIESASAAEFQQCDCPPPPRGIPFGPETFDRRVPDGDHLRWRTPLSELGSGKDGRISRAQVDRKLHERFREADADGDGSLDEEEFVDLAPQLNEEPGPWGPPPIPLPQPGERGVGERRVQPPAFHGGHMRPPDPVRMFRMRDWNLDGTLSFEEFAAPVRQMVAGLDRNGDGVVDPDELRGPFFFTRGPGFGPPPFPPPPRE